MGLSVVIKTLRCRVTQRNEFTFLFFQAKKNPVLAGSFGGGIMVIAYPKSFLRR